MEKDLARALALFREMPVEGVPYNIITYNSMMDACVKCGDLSSAEGLLREMTSRETSVEPDLISFSTILKGYCHNGELDKALQVAESMKARGLRSDELVYNTLMDGCVKVGDVSAGLGLFEEMVQVGLKPSAITNSILLRLYQKAGYEEGASEAVVQLYQRHGLERPACGDRNSRRGQRGGTRYGQSSPASSLGVQSPNVAQLGSPFGMDMAPLPGGYSNGSFHSNNSSACCSPYGSPTSASTFARSPAPQWHVPGSSMPHIPPPPQGPPHFMHGQGPMMPGWPQMPSPMHHPLQPPQSACFEGWSGAPNMAAQQQHFHMQQMRDSQQCPMWPSNSCPSSGPAAGESIMLS